MEAYGLVRINMELLPHAHFLFSPWLIIMGTIKIISHGFSRMNIILGIAIVIILTPIYSLSMSRQMFYGYKLFNIPNSHLF